MARKIVEPEPFELERFVLAQQSRYAEILDELRRGEKIGHWMWYIFPQMRGLGRSSMSHTYGISSIVEARAFLAHNILGPRLIKCTKLVLDLEGKPIRTIFSCPDDLKFCSSMTLFSQLEPPQNEIFVKALKLFFAGKRDQKTIRLLKRAG